VSDCYCNSSPSASLSPPSASLSSSAWIFLIASSIVPLEVDSVSVGVAAAACATVSFLSSTPSAATATEGLVLLGVFVLLFRVMSDGGCCSELAARGGQFVLRRLHLVVVVFHFDLHLFRHWECR